MEKGIFSKVFAKYTLSEAFTKIREFGFTTVQFNFSNVGLPSIPLEIKSEIIEDISKVSKETGVSISIISGTFNTLELDEEKRNINMRGFNEVVKAAEKLGVRYVSISTGSLDQEDFWRAHPDNHTDKAWGILFNSLDEMIRMAKEHNVIIVVEPEQANVISSVEDTIKLMKHYDSPNLKVLFDAANIVTTLDVNGLEEKINYALKELSSYIEIAHCKDCIVSNTEIKFAPIGKGNLPLNSYLKELKKYYNGPVIMHGLEENEIEHALKVIEF
ncbi:sugar phosphate isomerase/epimerase family protein [Enterococcus olivae]